MGEETCIPDGRRPLGNTGVDGRIILSSSGCEMINHVQD
jgi:hypothetical protein